MSRHGITLPNGAELVVGWDPPLRTYFAVVDDGIDDEPRLWIGTTREEITSVDDLFLQLGPIAEHVRHLAASLAWDRSLAGVRPRPDDRPPALKELTEYLGRIDARP